MKRFNLLLAGLCLLIVALGALWLLGAASPRYFRAPDNPPLDEPQYERVMDPQFKRIDEVTGFLESLVRTTNQAGVLVKGTYPANLGPQYDNTRYEYFSVKSGAACQMEKGTIRVKYMASAWGRIPEEDIERFSSRLPARFFDANYAPLSETEARELFPSESERRLQFRGEFPAVQVGLDLDYHEDFKVLGYHAFDPLLKRALISGHGWGRSDETQYVRMDLKMWHAGPVELVMDLAVGPPLIFEASAEEGSVLTYPEGRIKIAAAAYGFENRTTSQNNDSIQLQMEPVSESEMPVTGFIFACLPKAHHMPFEFEFLDRNGELLPTGGWGSGGQFMNCDVRAPLEDISKVRLKYYPDLKRIVFRLDQIPGLPEKNRSIENLFDVRIPYLRIQRDYQTVQILESLTGLNVARPSLNLNAVFPIVYENIDVGELLSAYAAMQGPRWEASVDLESRRIEFVDGSFQARWGRFKRWIEKKLSR